MKSLLGKLGVIVVIGLPIFTCADVWGADWKPYFTTEEELVFFDASSITRLPKNIVRVWIRADFTEKGVLNWVGDYGKKFENLSHLKSLAEINCLENTIRLLSANLYNNNGGVIDHSSFPLKWDFIIPETMGEKLYKEVCK